MIFEVPAKSATAIPAMISEKLFSDFSAPSKQEWIDKINVDLKGADYQKKMVWKTNEGFNVQPFYRMEDLKDMKAVDSLPGEFPFVRGNKKDNNLWFVRQEINAEDPKAANAKAIDILGKGVNSIGFAIPKAIVSKETVATLLEGICPECVELNFKTCQCASIELAKILVEYLKEKGADLAKVQGSIAFDPIDKILVKGKDTSAVIAKGKELIETLAEVPNFRCINVDSISLNNSGAYIYQELGYALAWGNEYMQQMVEAGVDATEAARRIKFNMGVSENYFMEIAKFRAARMLWAQIVKQYEPKCDCACKMNVCAITTEYNQTMYDSYVNLLRTQTEAMSAAIANVDSIVVVPFDKTYQTPDDFSERLARNQQLLLKEEAHFDKIVDVAGGSYYIETLTKSVADEAWKLFLELEEKGGYVEAFKSGYVVERVKASAAAKDKAIATRRQILLGANQYPNFNEVADAAVTAEAVTRTAAEGNVLVPYRGAMAFEAMRFGVDKSGKELKAFMLTCGNLAMARARAQFSCNFFACAGIRVMDNTFFKSLEEGVEAALASKAEIVVVCASDDDYAEVAPKIKEMLGGKAILVVAGAPACTPELEAQGITNFINVKSNVLETLKDYLKKLGI